MGRVTDQPPGPARAANERPRDAAFRVLRALVVSGLPTATISDLTERVGGHPNGVRLHLDALVADGFAEYAAQPKQTRGRPAKAYRATAIGRQVVAQYPRPRDFTALVEAFAEQWGEGPDAVASAQRLGTAWGERLAAETDPPGDLVAVLAGQGYTPEVSGDRIRLLTCPFVDTARKHPEIMCSLHAGLVSALTDRDARILPFAEPGACVIELARPETGR